LRVEDPPAELAITGQQRNPDQPDREEDLQKPNGEASHAIHPRSSGTRSRLENSFGAGEDDQPLMKLHSGDTTQERNT
jgi:hypothetical protein